MYCQSNVSARRPSPSLIFALPNRLVKVDFNPFDLLLPFPSAKQGIEKAARVGKMKRGSTS